MGSEGLDLSPVEEGRIRCVFGGDGEEFTISCTRSDDSSVAYAVEVRVVDGKVFITDSDGRRLEPSDEAVLRAIKARLRARPANDGPIAERVSRLIREAKREARKQRSAAFMRRAEQAFNKYKNELLSNPVQFMKDTAHIIVAGNDKTIEALVLGITTRLLSPGYLTHISIVGPPRSGKNAALETILQFIPRRMLAFGDHQLVSASPQALIYEATSNGGVIDMRGKILVISEAEVEELIRQVVLKRIINVGLMINPDEVNCHATVIDQKPVKLCIRGMPLLIFTTHEDYMRIEWLGRVLPISVDVSTSTKTEVLRRKAKGPIEPTPEFRERALAVKYLFLELLKRSPFKVEVTAEAEAALNEKFNEFEELPHAAMDFLRNLSTARALLGSARDILEGRANKVVVTRDDVERTWATLRDDLIAVANGVNSLHQMIASYIEEYLRSKGEAGAKFEDVLNEVKARWAGMTRWSVGKILKYLVEKGTVRKVGRTKGVRYYHADFAPDILDSLEEGREKTKNEEGGEGDS